MKSRWKWIGTSIIAVVVCLYLAWLYIETNRLTLEKIIAETQPSNLKVFLLGIDGADWSVINPLIEAGELPNLKILIEGGAHGVLTSEEPMKSPALWTTMVTGKDRDQHGIYDFLLPNPRSPGHLVVPMSEHRKAPALWNIASFFQNTVGFTGWWGSWPAEEVNGWIISSAFTHANAISALDAFVPGGTEHITHVTYPELLTDALHKHLVDPMDPPVEEIRALAELTDEEINQLNAVVRNLFGYGLSVLKFGYCAQRGHEEATLELIEKKQPDLSGILLPLVDMVSHVFWHYYEPDAFPEYVHTDTTQRLSHVIPSVYRYQDQFIGRLLDVLDSDTVIMIVSDHGFKARPCEIKQYPVSDFQEEFNAPVSGFIEKGITGDHHMDGVIIVSGGPVRKGLQIQASLYDIFPTVLALMGMPVPRDATGRVLTEMIDTSFFDKYPIKKISSYDRILPPHRVPKAQGSMHQESIDMLRGLGYIQ